MSGAPKFSSLRDDKLVSEFLFRLIGIDETGNISSFGTAFAFLPYLLITAKHVLDEFAKSHGGWSEGEVRLTFWAVQIEWKNGEHNYNVWLVTHAFSGTNGDIALLKISPLNDKATAYNAWKLTKVNLKIPKVGDEITGFGFHKTTFEGSRVTAGGVIEHIEMNSETSAAHGRVLEVYPAKRDAVMLPFSAARVNARFEPGMSGGPVINRRSELCGIVCSSMPIDDEHESYMTLLWPIVGIPFDFDTYDSSPVKGYKPLFELIKMGAWSPKGAARVEMVWDEVKKQSLVKYV
jgi:hypothetical protein